MLEALRRALRLNRPDQEGISLEPFKDPKYPIYWVDNPDLAATTLNNFTSSTSTVPVSIEFGPGEQFSDLWHIDPDANMWLTVEPNEEAYKNSRKHLKHYWPEPSRIPSVNVLALKTALDIQHLTIAHSPVRTLLYRNPNPNQSILLPNHLRQPLQRVVLIVDGTHISEANTYRECLREQGYDPNLLVPSDQPFSKQPSGFQNTLLFDTNFMPR